jgi:hypothetical protein
VDHVIYPMDASGVPFSAATFDVIADLAAEH